MKDPLDLSGRQPLFKYAELEDVRRIVESVAQPQGVETVDVRSAVGRYSAEDVLATTDLPGFDVSHVDGYAVSECGDRVFRVVAKDELGLCEAKYVETGQQVPKGAIAVVPVEAVRALDDGRVVVHGRVERDYEVIRRGVDVARGEVVCRRGQLITPPFARLLAELGYDVIKVYMRPKVLILPTGSEFASGVRKESTSILVRHMCEAVGAYCVVENPVEDCSSKIERTISQALEHFDVVVTIGGVSVGSADHTVKGVLHIPGARLYVRGMRVQPGRASSLAVAKGKPVIMLPGLFQSTIVGSIMLMQPILKRLQGSEPVSHYMIGLFRLSMGYSYTGRFASFTRVRFARLVDEERAEVEVEEAPSPVQRVVLGSHGFIIMRPGETRLERGSVVKLYRAPGLYMS